MPQAPGRLHVLDGSAAGRVVSFTESVRLGGAPDCEVVLPELSPVHATIEASGPGYVLRVPSGVIVDGVAAFDVELPSIAKVDFGPVGVMFEQAGGAYRGNATILRAPSSSPPYAPAEAVHSIGELVRPRASAGIAALDDDTVVIAGGAPPMRGAAFATAELFSVSRQSSREIALSSPRRGPTTTRLHDGRILIAGGDTDSAEILDPQTQTTTPVAAMKATRSGATAFALPSGLVVVLGGLFKPGPVVAEVFDPKRNAWGGLRSPELGFASVAPLDEQRFLVAAMSGGVAPRPPATYYVFDSGNWKFEAVAPPPAPRWAIQLVGLGHGHALVLGGYPQEHRRTVEWFELATRTFHPMADMLAVRGSPAIARLANGRVIVVGGDSLGTGLYSAEVFDPSTGVWTALPPVWSAANPLGAIARADGSAFVVRMNGVSIARDNAW